MEKQIVVRTRCNSFKDNGVSELQKHLDNGYTVLMVTPIIHTTTPTYKDLQNLQYQENEYILNPPVNH